MRLLRVRRIGPPRRYVVGAALGGAFKTLSGPEIQKTLRSLGKSFRQMIGPLTRGAASVLIVIGRVLQSSSAYCSVHPPRAV